MNAVVFLPLLAVIVCAVTAACLLADIDQPRAYRRDRAAIRRHQRAMARIHTGRGRGR